MKEKLSAVKIDKKIISLHTYMEQLVCYSRIFLCISGVVQLNLFRQHLLPLEGQVVATHFIINL